MIEEMKHDDIVRKVGGKFRFTALVQRRLRELIEGARPLVDTQGLSEIEIAIKEIDQDKISVDYDKTEDLALPTKLNEL